MKYLQLYLKTLAKGILWVGATILTFAVELKLLDCLLGYFDGNLLNSLLTFASIVAIIGILTQTHFNVKKLYE